MEKNEGLRCYSIDILGNVKFKKYIVIKVLTLSLCISILGY